MIVVIFFKSTNNPSLQIMCPSKTPELTHSQLLKGFKCESEIENNERIRSRGTFPSSHNFGGVEGHVGALGWD